MEKSESLVTLAAREMIAELEKLAKPIETAIATARRLQEIPQPENEDQRIAAGLVTTSRGFNQNYRELVAGLQNFARSLSKLEDSMRRTAQRG